MNRKKRRATRCLAVVAATTAAASIAACTPHDAGSKDTASTATGGGTATAGNPGQARQQLAGLPVAAPSPMTGYSRSKFGHGWKDQGHSCNTREIVLQRQGHGVTSDPKTCKITGGTWTSLYDGVTVHDAGQLDIDHLVPEAEAWRTGAAFWPADQREKFANDWQHELVAVTAHSNRSKGDGPPPEYEPVASERCDYSIRWIDVKSQYRLTVSATEKTALTQMLNTCR